MVILLCLLHVFFFFFPICKGEGSSYLLSGELFERDKSSVTCALRAHWKNGSYIYVLVPRFVSIDQEWPQQFSFSWHLMAWYLGNVSGQQ